jgi:multidrug efflux system membrane fusion protein
MRSISDWRRGAVTVACIGLSWAMSTPGLAAMTGNVVLPPASVSASGIEVAPLAVATQTSNTQAVATVLDLQPLLILSAQLQSLHAKVLAADAAAKAASAQATRSQALYRQDGNASLRDMQTAEAAAAAARAQRMTARAEEAAARIGARLQWGTVLAKLAGNGPQALSDYADGRAVLLEVVLPNGTRAPAGASSQVWSASGQPLTASLLDSSPRTDAVVQGPTFFYRAMAAGLRSGQRLSATVPLDAAVQQGVIVPAAAVIWYAGQPWVYVEASAGHFQRRPLVQARLAQDWFETSGFHAGEKVVVRGGELLLSQELQPPPGAAKPAGDGDDG